MYEYVIIPYHTLRVILKEILHESCTNPSRNLSQIRHTCLIESIGKSLRNSIKKSLRKSLRIPFANSFQSFNASLRECLRKSLSNPSQFVKGILDESIAIPLKNISQFLHNSSKDCLMNLSQHP